MAPPYPAQFADDNSRIRIDGKIDFTDPANQPGGSFVSVQIGHSAAFTNPLGSAPVVAAGVLANVSAVITLPPSAFGNNGIVNVGVFNDNGAAVLIGGSLVVQNAEGTVWIEQDTSSNQTVAAATFAPTIDFAANGGSAGAGLSWNAVTKQVDIANAGVFSAFVTLYALPS